MFIIPIESTNVLARDLSLDIAMPPTITSAITITIMLIASSCFIPNHFIDSTQLTSAMDFLMSYNFKCDYFTCRLRGVTGGYGAL